jgi:hypothetical protein
LQTSEPLFGAFIDRLAIENSYGAASRAGLRVREGAQAPKKADPTKEKPAKQVRAKPSKLGRMVNKKTCAACMGSHRAHTCGKAAPVY